MTDNMETKKDDLKSDLIGKRSFKKKPVIEETKAAKVTREIHSSSKEEPTIKTTIEFKKSLYKAMKIKMMEEDIRTMREYVTKLVEADVSK